MNTGRILLGILFGKSVRLWRVRRQNEDIVACIRRKENSVYYEQITDGCII